MGRRLRAGNELLVESRIRYRHSLRDYAFAIQRAARGSVRVGRCLVEKAAIPGSVGKGSAALD